MSIEVLRLALEALSDFDYDKRLDAITALRQAIEQVETQSTHSDGCWKWHHKCAIAKIERAEAQRQWVGLTHSEYEEAVDGLEDLEDCWMAIEAKLKEKNT